MGVETRISEQFDSSEDDAQRARGETLLDLWKRWKSEEDKSKKRHLGDMIRELVENGIMKHGKNK